MPGDNYFMVSATRLNLRRSAGPDGPIVTTLPRGTTVEKLAVDAADPAWWEIRTAGAVTGFSARRYLEPLSAGAPGLPAVVNQTLWALTKDAIAKGIKYDLGAKKIADGKIDCSGWVAYLTRAAFDAVNALAAPETVFDKADAKTLLNHSDGIVTGIEARTGKILHGTAVTIGNLREGMLIGIDFGAHTWEKGSPPRMYAIDHIVQVTRDPGSQELFVTQSSSSGHGVNMLPLRTWLKQREDQGLLAASRVHAVDPFLMADAHSTFIENLAPGA